MNIKIAPSILSADFAAMGAAVSELERAGADWIHCDVMDGRFVPNLTFGPKMIADLRARTALPLDAHLMIADPGAYLADFARAGADYITFHMEAADDPMRLLGEIHALGKKGGVVLNPETPAAVLRPSLVAACDMILVMSVHPGFGGQSFIPAALEKLRAVRAMIEASGRDVELEIDGGVGEDNAAAVRAAGATVLVAGSAVFRAADRAAVIRELRG